MLKLIVTRFWPVLLPLCIYLAWLWLARRKARKHGHGEPGFFDGPWLLAVVASLLLLILAFVMLGVSSSADAVTEGRYVPARVVNGEIVPAHIEPE
jgi:hypothetical protein